MCGCALGVCCVWMCIGCVLLVACFQECMLFCVQYIACIAVFTFVTTSISSYFVSNRLPLPMPLADLAMNELEEKTSKGSIQL